MAQQDKKTMIHLIIATCKELADEKLKCLNMMSLLELSISEFNDPNMNVTEGTLIAVLAKYWQMRLKSLPPLMILLKELKIEDEDIERFIRHNEI